MTTEIQGKVFYLDRVNINTDEIILATHLDGVSFSGLGPYLFENFDLPGFNPKNPRFKEASILVTRDNFGCGSSREHAVWALQDEGFQVVIVPSFASIFRQNMFYRGRPAIELPAEIVNHLFTLRPENCQIDIEDQTLRFWSGEDKNSGETYRFELMAFDKKLVLEGGLVEFVVKNY